MTHEFESLGDGIRKMLRDFPQFQPEDEETPLSELQRLPPTADVLADLDALRMRLDALDASQIATKADRQRAATYLAHAEKRYADAIHRDAIQSGRPSGCWCLGYGGSGIRYLPMPNGTTYIGHDGAERATITEHEVLAEYCGCPDGQARKAEDNAARERYRSGRTRQAIINRFGQANLPLEYRAYPWREHPDRRAVARVNAWMADPKTEPNACHWLLLYGPGGRGKTTFLAGIAAELTEDGLSVLFQVMPDLLSAIRETWGKPEDEARLKLLLKTAGWLFLDDVGAEAPKDWVSDFVYEVLNARHNAHLPVLMSSNLPPRELALHVGERIWGRIKRMAEPIEMAGPDLRDRP